MKPNPVSELLEKASKIAGESGLRQEIESGVKASLQSALDRMDVVTRDEFDAQAAVLQRTRQRLEKLEQQVIALNQQLEALQNNG